MCSAPPPCTVTAPPTGCVLHHHHAQSYRTLHVCGSHHHHALSQRPLQSVYRTTNTHCHSAPYSMCTAPPPCTVTAPSTVCVSNHRHALSHRPLQYVYRTTALHCHIALYMSVYRTTTTPCHSALYSLCTAPPSCTVTAPSTVCVSNHHHTLSQHPLQVCVPHHSHALSQRPLQSVYRTTAMHCHSAPYSMCTTPPPQHRDRASTVYEPSHCHTITAPPTCIPPPPHTITAPSAGLCTASLPHTITAPPTGMCTVHHYLYRHTPPPSHAVTVYCTGALAGPQQGPTPRLYARAQNILLSNHPMPYQSVGLVCAGV